nr:5'-nucleotidase C-terminal domain-containing protein [Geoanaerobacter pelophilus]
MAINDFHGQLSPKTVSGRPAGGAAVLASYLKKAQSGMEDRTIIVSDGDFVGASPANSALLQDEPSIQFLNTLANPYCLTDKMNARCNLLATVGNHEFDEGTAELFRMMNGGNHAKGPFIENPYSGAHFPYIAANVIDTATGKPLLPPYIIKTVRNTPIAFIGAILKDTPNIVAPAGVVGLTFIDEATAINSYIPELQAKGVKAIVGVIHQGAADVDTIVGKLDGEIDLVISGHSHGSVNKLVNNVAGRPVLVTQAYSAGTAYADINIEISPSSKDIVAKSANIVTTFGDAGAGLTPDTAVAGIVATADTVVAPLVSVPVGETSDLITRSQTPAGESALGNLIADAQRAYEGTDFAFMNPGGIRADLDKGIVTWGELFTIQPFGNQMVRMSMTGQQIYDLLAQQWSNPASPKMLQISGLSYSWINNGAGKAGTINEVRKNGVEIDTAATYTVTTNNFLSGGGDGFTVFKNGLNPVIDAADIDVLVSYIRSLPVPFDVNIDNRIVRSEAAPIQFVYTSDAHYGITRKDLVASTATVNAQAVNQALVASINSLQSTIAPVAIPCDNGVNACASSVGALDFVAETGDVANRQEASKLIQSAAASWTQFEADYLNGLTVTDRNNTKAPLYLVPGNHDVSNAIGYYKTLSPAFDATSYVNIYNLMLNPITPLTNAGFIGTSATDAAASYAGNKVYYSKDIGGVHFVFIGMWPDSAARAWMDADLRKVSSTTPVVLFTHDEPLLETKHLINPNEVRNHTINSTDKFENLVLGEGAGGYASVATINDPSTVEQRALVAWLKNHKNVVAYFHGNTNYNEFYTYAGPDSDISLNTFRVDSPMKGMVSGIDAANGIGDPSKLSFQVVSIDPGATQMTVREYLWNTKTWGTSKTVSLAPRSN